MIIAINIIMVYYSTSVLPKILARARKFSVSGLFKKGIKND